MDYRRYSPAIDPAFFPDTQPYYWSSTFGLDCESCAWYLSGVGGMILTNVLENLYVRAVRAGQCGLLGDFDVDGICDDADNSSIAGDNPCTGGETVNCDDNCMYVNNFGQNDFDNDTIGDACDNCPNDNNTVQTDTDNDTIGDVCDICPNDSDNDIDNDTICGDVDLCPSDPTNDADNDTICGLTDNCPMTPNGTGLGTCVKLASGVFIGTEVICEGFQDCEEDEACQQNQQDSNLNGIGDVCECYADCDNDTEVGLFDLIVMKGEYGRSDCAVTSCYADCNDDGGVGLFDLIIMKTEYGKGGCPVVQ